MSYKPDEIEEELLSQQGKDEDLFFKIANKDGGHCIDPFNTAAGHTAYNMESIYKALVHGEALGFNRITKEP